MTISSIIPAAPLPTSRAPAAVPSATPQGSACCHAAAQHAPLLAATVPAPTTPLRAHAGSAARNTALCLFGCSLGDVGVVVFSRLYLPHASFALVMVLAIGAGLVTSVLFETLYLRTQGQPLARALRLALGMSLVSMISMEIAMNAVDLGLTGGMRMQLPWAGYLGILLIGEVAGFAAAFPYNWWRLARLGRSCH